MSHLSHKFRWSSLNIEDEKQCLHFARIFANVLQEFHATSRDKPNYYNDGWPDDVDSYTATEKRDAIYHEVNGYDLYECQSMGGIINYLVHDYIEVNLILTDRKYYESLNWRHGGPLYYRKYLSDVVPRRWLRLIEKLIEHKDTKVHWADFGTRVQATHAHEYLKILFRMLYRNLDLHSDRIEEIIVHILYTIRRKITAHRDYHTVKARKQREAAAMAALRSGTITHTP